MLHEVVSINCMLCTNAELRVEYKSKFEWSTWGHTWDRKRSFSITSSASASSASCKTQEHCKNMKDRSVHETALPQFLWRTVFSSVHQTKPLLFGPEHFALSLSSARARTRPHLFCVSKFLMLKGICITLKQTWFACFVVCKNKSTTTQ